MMIRISGVLALLMTTSNVLHAEHPIRFQVQRLAVDANEGCDVADFDGDGKLDVVAGRFWFHNPDWTARPVRAIEDVNGYVHSNGDFAYDVNHDGRPDVVAGGFFQTTVHWYENPGPEAILNGFLWPQHLLVDTGLSQNEASDLRDFNGDGTPDWISNSWNKNNPLVIWTLAEETRDVDVKQGQKTKQVQQTVPVLQRNLIHEGGQGHGIGFGDINNDGREDILTGTGWHERPAGDPFENPWKYHPDWDAHWSCPVIVRDLNQDGKNDILWGNPHDYGLFVWYADGTNEAGQLKFREEVIDRDFSQLHCLHLADLDGDGTDELITGKRVRAHNGKDPGGTEPPLVCYYTIDAQGTFQRHTIVDGTVGIGLQIRTADLDGDGDLDIVVAGKDGTQILFSQLK